MKRVLLTLLLAAGSLACDGIRVQCEDEIDNDGDGLIDGEDPGCAFNAARDNALDANCQSDQSSGLTATNPACQVSATGFFESD
ncbi:MAG: hypothetical protein AAF658_17430, partial [Myxococcota bacterium]